MPKGDGKYNQPVKLNKGKDDNPNQKGVEIKEIWTGNDSPAVRGGSPGRDKTGH
jgi:hypothetical protein